MCGLVGCVGKIWSKEEAAFKTLLQLDTIRGPHSTGVLSVLRDKGKWAYEKEVGTAWDLMSMEVNKINIFDRLMRRTHGVLLGHNRFATKGRITSENAHPFEHSGVIGAHNGTLTTQWNLKDYKMFDVDSDNIIYNIAEEGAEETLKKLQGAFALTWYDSETHSVSLVRNEERPLCFCLSKDNKTLFWASESWMLHIALQKAGLDFQEIKMLAPKKLMTIEVPLVCGTDMSDLNIDVLDVEFYKPPDYGKPRGWWDNSSNCWKEQGGIIEKEDVEKNTQAQPAGAKGTEKTSAVTHQKVVSLQERRNMKVRLAEFLGKSVTFSAAKVMKEGSLDYILCDVEDVVNPPELRIFVKKDSTLGRMLLESTSLFRAKVAGHTMSGNSDRGYIRVDHRTIMEVEEDIDVLQGFADSLKELHLNGYANKKLNLEEFYRITNTGCASCGDLVSPRQCNDLLWIDGSNFFCPACRNTEIAAQYSSYINQD